MRRRDYLKLMGSAALTSALRLPARAKTPAQTHDVREQFGVSALTLGAAGRQNGLRLSRFVRAGGFADITPTSVLLWWDEASLHVEFRNNEPSPRYKGNPGLAKPNRYPGNGRFDLAAYPDAVYVQFRPSWNADKVYEFAVDSSGAQNGDGFASDVTRLPGRWLAHFKIDWTAVDGIPQQQAFGLNVIRSRGQSSEVLSPIVLDQSLKLCPDLLMFARFGHSSAVVQGKGTLDILANGAKRWQLPSHLLNPGIEECQDLWRQQSALNVPTSSANIDARVRLAQRLHDLLVLEGFSFHTDGSNWRVGPREFYPHEARIAVNHALMAGDEPQACVTLDTYLGQLDRSIRRWFADESPANTRSEQWMSVHSFGPAVEEGNELRVTAMAGALETSLWISEANGAIRIRNVNKGIFDPQEVVLPQHVATAGHPRIVLEQTPWRLVVFDDNGLERWSLREGELFLRLSSEGEVLAVDLRRPLGVEENLYGFGERFNALGQRKNVVTLWGVDCWDGNVHGQLNQAYKNIPLIHSTAGYSLFWNSTYRLRADVGATVEKQCRLTAFGNILDLFIWPCSAQQVLQRYTDLTGKPLIPPPWAFEPWMGGGGRRWANGPLKNAVEEELRVIEHFRELDIPHSAIYAEGSGNSDPKLYEELRDTGLHVFAWMYESMDLTKVRELMPGVPDAELPVLHHRDGSIAFRIDDHKAIIDYTHPAAEKLLRAFWQPRFDLGLAGSMVDFGDVTPDDAIFANGKNGTEMHNFYARSYHAAYSRVFGNARNNDDVLFARAACAGDQQSVCHFAGDHQANFFGMRAALRGGLNAAACGLSNWGPDAGGYAGWPDPEVYIRWTEWAAFCPLMRFHGTTPREPWEYGEETVAIYKKFAWLRESLLPYIMKCADEAHRTGVSMLRPMPFAFPASGKLASCDDQYLFGPDLLIAPMLGPGDSRPVVLPPGMWTDFWTGRSLRGDQLIDAEMPLDRIGIFLRAGAQVLVDLPSSLVPEESMSSRRVRCILATRPLSGERWSVNTSGVEFLIKLGSGRKLEIPLHGKEQWTEAGDEQ